MRELPVVLRADGLCFGFGKPALCNGLSATIPPGVTWVGGDESTGKTTLLRLLAGELLPHRGTLHIHGMGLHENNRAYRSHVSWVDPRTPDFDGLTPKAYWDRLRQQHPAFADTLLSDLVGGLALESHLSKSLNMLSTGTKRKVFLAGAFASGAALTLLDEPFAALDKASTELVLELLQEAATHPDKAWVVADYVAPRGVALAAAVMMGGVI